MSMRTDQMQESFEIAKERGELRKLNEEAWIRTWDYWILVVNRFWHDKKNIFGLMIVTKRDSGNIWLINKDERDELFDIVGPWLDQYFDCMTFNLASMRSNNDVAHGHVDILKDEYRRPRA